MSQKFFDWFDARTADVNASEAGRRCAAAGFEIYHTGGGCLAFRRPTFDLGHILITDEDGDDVRADSGGKWLVGSYDREENPNLPHDKVGGDDEYGRLCDGLEEALITAMTTELIAFCDQTGRTWEDANELYAQCVGRPHAKQHEEWLKDFIDRWNAAINNWN